jgi:hypothetical protein
MNRRGFLGRFAGMAGVPVAMGAVGASRLAIQNGVDLTASEFEYRGFIVRWTGWKCNVVVNCYVAGQYWAYPVGTRNRGPFFYASYPGAEGQFRQGDAFDVSMKPNQTIMPLDAKNLQDKQIDDDLQRLTWLRLRAILDDYADGGRSQIKYRIPAET